MTRGLVWVASLGCVACFSEPPSIPEEGGSGSGSTETSPAGTSEGSAGLTTSEPDTTATAGDPETTTGVPQPCTDDAECTDPSMPFCSPVLQECVSCSGMPDPQAACQAQDPGLPACSDGVCVQCTGAATDACEDQTPACDERTNTCVACTEHAQCGAAACNLFTGECLPQDAVLTVGPAQDFVTLNAAVSTIPAGGQGTILVSDGTYDESVVIDGSRVVAFLADGAAQPQWQRTLGFGAPQLVVSGAATVLMEGIALRGNASAVVPELRVEGASAWVDRGTIVQASGGAVTVVDGSALVLRNCFLSAAADTQVLRVQGSTAEVLYSTVAAGLGITTALACDAASAVTVRDSIVVSRSSDPEVACGSIDAQFSAVETVLPGVGNTAVGDVVLPWFVDYNGGDFHLTPAGQGVFDGLARWNDAPREPRVDIDGELRAGLDGVSEHAGADLP